MIEPDILLVSILHVVACLVICGVTFIARPKSGGATDDFVVNMHSSDSLMSHREMNRFVVKLMLVVGSLVVTTSLLLVRMPEKHSTGSLIEQLEKDDTE